MADSGLYVEGGRLMERALMALLMMIHALLLVNYPSLKVYDIDCIPSLDTSNAPPKALAEAHNLRNLTYNY
jgi:hypothetical protein